ncbi:MAG: nucleotidyltransferase domain-containing protein [Thermodesulfobacteriota bacterium]
MREESNTVGIPEELARDAAAAILSEHAGIKALIVIGSVAAGDYMPDSDVDLVCIIDVRLSVEERHRLRESVPERVQLVILSREELKGHFENSTTMAHAIRKGKVLYEEDGYLRPFFKKETGLPSREWMKQWFLHWLKFFYLGLHWLEREKKFHGEFCKERCECSISDDLARAAVNFSILYLESRGTVPVSKGEIEKGIEGLVPEGSLRGMNVALKVCHEDRAMNYQEALQVEDSAKWLKEKLIEWLDVSESEMAEISKVYQTLT